MSKHKKITYEKLFTGVPDVDREILLRVPDKELYATRITDQYAVSLCNETFWHNKFRREFGTDLGKYADNSYYKLYKKLRNKTNKELIEISAKRGYLPLVKIIFPIDKLSDSRTILDMAAQNGHLDIVKYLHENGANIHSRNDYAFLLAAENGHLDVVKYLHENGVDIHTQNDLALRWAAIHGHLDVVKYLVEKGADIHVDNDQALQWAAKNGYLDIIEYLVENGANISILKNSNDKRLKQIYNDLISSKNM